MANNFVISFQIGAAERAAAAVQTIQGLGAATELHPTLWALSSTYSAEEIADRVWRSLGGDDRLVVVDSSNDDVAWFNLSDEAEAVLTKTWRDNR